MKKHVGFIALVASVLASAPVQAVPVTFFGEDRNTGETFRLSSHPNSDAARASFLASLVGVGTENFEGFSDGAPVPLSLSFAGSSGGITATLSGSGYVRDLPGTGTSAGRYPISGTKFLQEVFAGTGGTAFTVDFSTPVAAFGFYGTDFGDFDGVAELRLNGTTVQTVSIGNSINIPGAGCLYFGVIDTANPFNSVVFRNTNPGGGDYFGFDDMTVGDVRQVIPTPDSGATLMLLGTALSGLVLLRRRFLS